MGGARPPGSRFNCPKTHDLRALGRVGSPRSARPTFASGATSSVSSVPASRGLSWRAPTRGGARADPARNRGSTRPALVNQVGRISRSRVACSLHGAVYRHPPLPAGHSVQRLTARTSLCSCPVLHLRSCPEYAQLNQTSQASTAVEPLGLKARAQGIVPTHVGPFAAPTGRTNPCLQWDRSACPHDNDVRETASIAVLDPAQSPFRYVRMKCIGHSTSKRKPCGKIRRVPVATERLASWFGHGPWDRLNALVSVGMAPRWDGT